MMLADLSIRRALRLTRPRTSNQLHAYVRAVLGFTMPRRPLVPGHAAPFAYLEHAYFEDRQPRDCVVWANRGGGKTQLGAIATLMDLIFKPGIQVRILGGSFEQSSKMYRYLKALLEDDLFNDLVAGNITGRAVELVTGSRVEVLSQSERAVRGQRVHKLRCDEIELFEPEIWDAAQMVTRSGRCGETFVRGSIESLSTMHRPFGMMQRIVRDAAKQNRRIYRWSVLDTLEKCPMSRPCEGCRLWDDCRGRAKRSRGFVRIDDAIQQHERVGHGTWRAEMLCREPSRSSSVYPEFTRHTHVTAFAAPKRGVTWVGGIDFGYRAPTVILWAFVDTFDVLHVVDELVLREHRVEVQHQLLRQRPWPRPAWFGVDPAGHQRSEQTGQSTIALWRRAGFTMRTRSTPLESGIAAVRRRLRRADGSASLLIHPRCEALIKSMVMYHYPPDKPESLQPVKDGHDHAADALRYLVVNLDRGAWEVEVRTY